MTMHEDVFFKNLRCVSPTSKSFEWVRLQLNCKELIDNLQVQGHRGSNRKQQINTNTFKPSRSLHVFRMTLQDREHKTLPGRPGPAFCSSCAFFKHHPRPISLAQLRHSQEHVTHIKKSRRLQNFFDRLLGSYCRLLMKHVCCLWFGQQLQIHNTDS